MIEAPREAMLELMSRVPELSDHIITVFAARRQRQFELKNSSVKVIGAAPNTAWLSGHVDTDERGFVLTGADVGRPSPFETGTDGVFAVGDARAGSVKRVASAVGEGSVVVSQIWSYLDGLESQTKPLEIRINAVMLGM